jgi:hypothetical protein
VDSNTPLYASWLVTRIGELSAAARRRGRPLLVSRQGPHSSRLELFHNSVIDGHVMTILDVSEQRRAEETLREAQNMESLGRITGGWRTTSITFSLSLSAV